ncbi:MAG: hypothetical protein V2A55_00800 [Candidatus Jorgensenbacteria bacterium]
MDRIIKFFADLLEKLSSKPKIGGLVITDASIQYLFLDGETPKYFSVRLPPGVMKEGKIEAPDQFTMYLRELRRLAASGQTQAMKVVVALPPAAIYTQSFNVPKINEEKLEEASRLNLQIISPIDAGKAFMSSQVIGETEDRYDILGAFIDKEIVIKMKDLLIAAGFEPLIFEFPTLALTRVVSASLKLQSQPVLILQVSSDGLDLAIVRGGELYFEYFRSWHSIQGEGREITHAAFESAVAQEVKRVIDFSLSRFKENLSQALIIAPGFENEIIGLFGTSFGFQAVPLVLKSYSLAPNWYVALGSAIRGKNYSDVDREINLSGMSLKEVFREERIMSFIGLWRNIVAGVALIMLIIFGGSAAMLVSQSKTATARLTSFTAQISETELASLKAKVSEFNNLVASVEQAKELSRPWHEILSNLRTLADENNVTLDGFGVGATGGGLSLSGRAPSTSQVLKFKNILVEEEGFLNVNLPLAAITTLEDNSVGFSVSFEVK